MCADAQRRPPAPQRGRPQVASRTTTLGSPPARRECRVLLRLQFLRRAQQLRQYHLQLRGMEPGQGQCAPLRVRSLAMIFQGRAMKGSQERSGCLDCGVRCNVAEHIGPHGSRTPAWGETLPSRLPTRNRTPHSPLTVSHGQLPRRPPQPRPRHRQPAALWPPHVSTRAPAPASRHAPPPRAHLLEGRPHGRLRGPARLRHGGHAARHAGREARPHARHRHLAPDRERQTLYDIAGRALLQRGREHGINHRKRDARRHHHLTPEGAWRGTGQGGRCAPSVAPSATFAASAPRPSRAVLSPQSAQPFFIPCTQSRRTACPQRAHRL
jgi:hypothetical protein